MKKILVVIMLFTLVIGLVSCMKEEDYYTRDDVDALLQDQWDDLADDFQEMQDKLDTLKPTQAQRFFFALVENDLLGGEIVFTEVGQTVEGNVEYYGYAYIVIELEESMTVKVNTSTVAPEQSWDMYLYINKISEPKMSFEGISATGSYVMYLEPGFNIIEIDSYYGMDHPYKFEILSFY